MAGPGQTVDFEALRRLLDDADARLSGAVDAARREEVLATRAEAIASAREATRPDAVAVVAFTVGGERYAVPVAAVAQVLEARGIHPLPVTPPWLLGAMVARAQVVPVVDLRVLLGLAGGGLVDLGRVVVVEHDGDLFGLAVEVLEGRLEVPRAGLAKPAEGPFEWIAPDRLALLDLGALGARAAAG